MSSGSNSFSKYLPGPPDLLGYMLGFIVLWLLYTGYDAARVLFANAGGALEKPKAVVSEVPEAKPTVAEASIGSEIVQKLDSAKENLTKKFDGESTWSGKLNVLNGEINKAVSYTSGSIQDIIEGREESPEDEKKAFPSLTSSGRKPVEKKEASTQPFDTF